MINTLNQYWYSWKPIASINNGIKSWNNIGWLSQFIGTPIPNHFDSYNKRAFAWEADPMKTYPILIKAVQQLSELVETLTQRVVELESGSTN